MLVKPEIQRTVQPDLEAGEQLLWAGQPKPARVALEPFTLISSVFGVFFILFVLLYAKVYLDTGGYSAPTPASSATCARGNCETPTWLPPIIMVVFFLIGLGMVASPLVKYLKAKRTYYALTNKRLLLVQVGKSRNLQSYTQDDVGNIGCTQREDRSGNLTFLKRQANGSETEFIQFVGIPDVSSVEHLVRNVFKKQS
jgi:hypothetical protein